MRRLPLLLAVVGAVIALPVGATASAPSTMTVQVDDHYTICGGVVQVDIVGVAKFKGFNELYPDVWREGLWNWNETVTYTNTDTHVSLHGVSVGSEHYKTDGVLDADGYLHYVTQVNGNVLSVRVRGQAPITYLKGRWIQTYVVDPATSFQVGDRTMVTVNGIYHPYDEYVQMICDYLVP